MTDDLLQLRIIRIHSETSDAKSYFLELVDGRPIQHRAGQFLTLLLMHNGHEVRRSYSLSSAENETLRLTIKRIQNGEISRYLLDTLQVGDVLTSLYPAGRFVVDERLSGDLVTGRPPRAVEQRKARATTIRLNGFSGSADDRLLHVRSCRLVVMD